MYTVELLKMVDGTFNIWVSDSKKTIDVMKRVINCSSGKIVKVIDSNVFTLECDITGIRRLLDGLYYECESHEIEAIGRIFTVARFYY